MAEPTKYHNTVYLRTSENGRKMIRAFEGEKLKAYQDVAELWTVGVGHLITKEEQKQGYIKAGTDKIVYGKGITKEQSDTILANDLFSPEQAQLYIRPMLLQNRIDAIVSLVFNIGLGNFFNSTLLEKINGSMDDREIKEQWLKWNRAGGKMIPGLAKRREKELIVWQTGNYSPVFT